MSANGATRGKMTHDRELLVISRMYDMLASLPAERRVFVADYIRSRVSDMPAAQEAEPAASGPLLSLMQTAGQAVEL